MTRNICMLFLPAAVIILLAAVHISESVAEKRVAQASELRKCVPVLMYHKVNPDPAAGGFGLRVTPEAFERQMLYLYDHGFNTVSLVDLREYYLNGKGLPPRPVVITLDDGYLDNFTYAYPVLKKYGMNATLFVVAGTVGKYNSFDHDAGKQPKNPMAGWQELKEMAQGGITIGAHTLNHPHLADLSAADALLEIAAGKRVLEEGIGRPVEVFCYPYGSYSEEIVRMVGSLGFLAAVTSDQGFAEQDDGMFRLKRIRVRGDFSYRQFLERLDPQIFS